MLKILISKAFCKKKKKKEPMERCADASVDMAWSHTSYDVRQQ